jgi:hypothetical protein
MTDTTLTDLGPFFERYDRRQRLVFVAALPASLVLSAVIFAHNLFVTEHGVKLPAVVVASMWAFGIVFPPAFMAGWWIFTERMARRRRMQAPRDGSHPASVDDARNGMRIANGGFAFNVGVTASVFIQQAFIALIVLGFPLGDLIPRATCVAVGAVTIYLGNLMPRMPVARAPERTAAIRMKIYRRSGWLMVVFGLLVVALGVFLPLIYPLVRALPRP